MYSFETSGMQAVFKRYSSVKLYNYNLQVIVVYF